MRLVLPLHILATVPIWIQAPIYFLLSIGIIWMLRDAQEGIAYNAARSSQLGDAALLTIVLMAISMLQDGRPVPPPLNLACMQTMVFVIAVAVGLLWYFWLDPTVRWGDRYHHLVVAPMLVYLGINAGLRRQRLGNPDCAHPVLVLGHLGVLGQPEWPPQPAPMVATAGYYGLQN
jgi:hypothetical protein